MIKRALALIAFTLVSPLIWAQSPAGGVWDFSMSSPMGSVDAKVLTRVEGEKLTGSFDLGGGHSWAIEDGMIKGNTISFNINRDGASFTNAKNAQIDGDTISGTASAMASTVVWSMSRES